MSSQQTLFIEDKKKNAHGGETSKGKRKTRRPLDPKRLLHVVLRSSNSLGRKSFHHFRGDIDARLRRDSRRWGVRIWRRSTNTNHLHLVIQGKDRRGIQNFLRSFAGSVAMRVGGGRKGRPGERKFWDAVVFTRIVEWGREFRRVVGYVFQNDLETRGLVEYRERGERKRERAGARDGRGPPGAPTVRVEGGNGASR